MSWPDLVQSQLIATGNVSKAAICGLDGNIWAQSTGFTASPQELAAAISAFDNPNAVLGVGLHFANQKYFVLRADSECVIGKLGAGGVFIHKTGKAIIVSIYEGGIQPEACNTTTGALADYLRSTGY
ncbi:unnamed protein product [Auanema sp. JU1783]|nr:unnamed protein product [Auanema sp. JU1783]